MDMILSVVQYFIDLGAAVMLPLVIFVIAILLGTPISRAVKSGISIGIGFIGIGLVISLMLNNLAPAATAMSANFGISLSVIDIGWPGSSPMAWASRIALVAIPLSIVVNLIMIALKLTRVVNIDIWNIWHFTFTGTMVDLATGSYTMAMQAFRAGYTSIMIDGSKLAFEENIALTKSVVDVCHASNVPVEGELGKVGGKEDDLENDDDNPYTDPQEAKKRFQTLDNGYSRLKKNREYRVIASASDSEKTPAPKENELVKIIADALLGEKYAVALVARSTGNNLEMEKSWELMSELDKDAFIQKRMVREL